MLRKAKRQQFQTLFEAAPGAEAIVRGSSLLISEWRLSQSPRRRSMNVWETDLPEEYFAEDRPFSLENASEEDFDIMRWARDVRGHIPSTLRRVMIFEDGRRLTQLATYEDVHRVPGSFYIDVEKKKLHVKPIGDTDPSGAEFEATTRQCTVVARGVIANNHIHHCGWQEVEPYWETAGIKILYTLSALVQCNYIHHCYAAPAFWIDFKNRNTRICRNLAHDISSYHGAIFFEASDERVDCAVPLDYFDVENVSDHNLFAGPRDDHDLAEWQTQGLDAHSRVVLDILQGYRLRINRG